MAGGSIQIDLDLLRAFERALDPRRPERSAVPAHVLGYGEISTVFAIRAEGLRGLAFKRLPIFETMEEAARYRDVYTEYNRLLADEVGLCLPPHGYVVFLDDTGRPIFYIVQQQLPPASVGNRALGALPREGVRRLARRILGELQRVWDFNRRQGRWEIAVDAQLSNWSIAGFDPARPRPDEDAPLVYMDTSTPLFRLGGVEQLEPELFLRSAPSFLAWLLRLLFLQDVVNRYYDRRRVVIDLIANLYKERRPDLVPDLIEVSNAFLLEQAPEPGLEPISEREVRAYYREDALIWSLYQSMRRVDRFLHTRLLQRPYRYVLPGRIAR